MATRSGVPEEGTVRTIRKHRIQRWLVWLAAPLWVPITEFWVLHGFGYRLGDLASTRRVYRRAREDSDTPLLICANHLTLIDSLLVACALSGSWRFLVDFDSLPWNVPEESNFANTVSNRILVYLAKCIPIRRGGSREDVSDVLKRVTYLLGRGEVALLFPEGGRSRTGRVEVSGAGWGVGRIVSALEGCRVLCIYLRGENQKSWSDWPQRGDRFHISVACIEPKSDARGVRGTRDIANQIVSKLAQLEAEYFTRRGQPEMMSGRENGSTSHAGS